MLARFLLLAALLLPAASFAAEPVNLKKIKKWPAEEQTLVKAFDSYMSQEELDILVKLKTSEERIEFIKKLGYMDIWEGEVSDEAKPRIAAGEVVEGMTEQEVKMAWDLPKRIRKDFRKDAYVDVMNYEFERDRKGREFLLRPDSVTAYKNDIFIRLVYMYDGRVFRVVDEGSEENVMDELPIDEPAPTPAPEPDPEAAPEGGTEGSAEGGESPAKE
jgi:hypothetical protein